MSTVDTPIVPKPRAVATPTGAEQVEDTLTENRMRDYFASQPRVSIKTREDQWVQVNGYTFIIQKDVRVEVPKGVADILEEAGRI